MNNKNIEKMNTEELMKEEFELYNRIKEQLDKKGNDMLADLCEIEHELTRREIG